VGSPSAIALVVVELGAMVTDHVTPIPLIRAVPIAMAYAVTSTASGRARSPLSPVVVKEIANT